VSVTIRIPDRPTINVVEQERVVVSVVNHGPPGPRGEKGEPGDITADDFPDFTLIFDNQLI